MRSNSLLEAYNRARLLRKVMLGVFCSMFGITVLWALPWVPWGLTQADYTSNATVPVALALGAWLSAFGAVYLRDKTNRYEQALVTWTSVRDELGDLRRREYFYERTVIECTRAEQNNVPFAVFAMRLETTSGQGADTMAALEVLSALVRQNDTLAALSPHEVGVLAVGMGQREAPAFALRLRNTLQSRHAHGNPPQISMGCAIWGADAREAGALAGIARQRMQQEAASFSKRDAEPATLEDIRQNEGNAA